MIYKINPIADSLKINPIFFILSNHKRPTKTFQIGRGTKLAVEKLKKKKKRKESL